MLIPVMKSISVKIKIDPYEVSFIINERSFFKVKKKAKKKMNRDT